MLLPATDGILSSDAVMQNLYCYKNCKYAMENYNTELPFTSGVTILLNRNWQLLFYSSRTTTLMQMWSQLGKAEREINPSVQVL